MSLIESIEKNHYLATEQDVEALARSFLDAETFRRNTRSTYFRILLAGAQVELTGKPTLRAPRGRHGSLSDEAKAAQAVALDAVHTRLYAAVLKGVVTPEIEGGTGEEGRRRALERNRRSGFARSAASTLRRYVREGGDLTRLSVLTATKNSLTQRQAGVPGEDRARKLIARAARRFAAQVERLAGVDRGLAVEAVRMSMDEINAVLLRYAGRPTDKPQVAADEHRPLKTPVGMFLPAIGVSARVQ